MSSLWTLVKRYKLVLINSLRKYQLTKASTEKISTDKGIHKNFFSEWKGNFMSSVNEKIHTLKTKITRGPLKSISVKMMFSLKEDFRIVLLKRQLKMVFICKHFYALTITK